jgi:hypothetical protein
VNLRPPLPVASLQRAHSNHLLEVRVPSHPKAQAKLQAQCHLILHHSSHLTKKDPVRHLVSLQVTCPALPQVLSPAVTVPKSRKAVALECGPHILASVYVSGLTALA